MIEAAIPYIVGLGISAVIIFLVWFIEFRTTDEDRRLQKLSQELKEDGIRTMARVKSIESMGPTSSGWTILRCTLEVALPEESTYEVSENAMRNDGCYMINPVFNAYTQKKGAIIPVIVHPTEHQVLKIDEEKLLKLVQEQ